MTASDFEVALLTLFLTHFLSSHLSLWSTCQSQKTLWDGIRVCFCYKLHMILGGEVFLAIWQMPLLSSVQQRKWYGPQPIRKALLRISWDHYFQLVFVGFKCRDKELLSFTGRGFVVRPTHGIDSGTQRRSNPFFHLFGKGGEGEKSQECADQLWVLDSHDQDNGVDLEVKGNLTIQFSTQVSLEFNLSKPV